MQLPKGSYQSPKTKIICTIGPSTWDKGVLRQMYELGMTGARINASFADFDELGRVSKMIREISADIAVILDTQGHKIRLNKFEGVIELIEGSTVEIGCKKGSSTLWVDCPEALKSISSGKIVRIDNGLFELEILSIDGDVLKCRVVSGGLLTSAKTVNFP
ncbi:MAG: pyruvate kinase, partial [bacterium]